jgi:DNA-binding transcriptional MerR regulator
MTAAQERVTVNPGTVVVDGVRKVLELARTWLAWDGTPRVADDGVRIYTPNKVIRRHADHLIDHLAEIEALLADQETEPDEWHASGVTLASDWAAFTEAELNEAEQRLRRIAQAYVHRLAAADPQEWDKPRSPHWTIREIAEHVGAPWYAEQIGDLSRPAAQ